MVTEKRAEPTLCDTLKLVGAPDVPSNPLVGSQRWFAARKQASGVLATGARSSRFGAQLNFLAGKRVSAAGGDLLSWPRVVPAASNGLLECVEHLD